MSKIDFKQGLFWSSISQFGISGIQLLSTMILARLLTPHDFGLIAPLAIFISISTIIIDSGMGGYLVIKKNIDETDYSTLFFFNMGMSFFLYCILYLAAPKIASFYNTKELIQIIRIQSLTIIINGFSIIYYINLLRNQKFKTLAIINLSAGFFSLIVGILIGYFNFGVWALISQQLVFSLLYAVFLFLNFIFFPKFLFSFLVFKEQFSFGVNLLFANLLKTVSDNINSTVVAKIVSISQTGNFFQSSRIIGYCDGIANGIIDRALFPIFAKIEDRKQFINMYASLSFNILSIVIPIVSLLSIFADEITLLLLGNQWKDASWMLGVLSFALIPLVIQALCRTSLKSLGITKPILFNEAIKACAVLSLLLVASLFGLSAIIWSFVISQIISSLLIMYLVAHNLNHSYLNQILSVFSLLALTILSYYIIEWSQSYLIQSNAVTNVLLKLFGFITVYLTLLFFFRKITKKSFT